MQPTSRGLDPLQVLEHILPAIFYITVVLLVVHSLVRAHTQPAMYQHQPILPEHLLVPEHIRMQDMYRNQQILPVHLLVLELTPPVILAPELILAHMQTHLPVQEHIRVGILALEPILEHILVHMRAIQFKQLKIQYQQYLFGFVPLKLYYILYIISFYGELNDCG